jgi:hypothetical protein
MARIVLRREELPHNAVNASFLGMASRSMEVGRCGSTPGCWLIATYSVQITFKDRVKDRKSPTVEGLDGIWRERKQTMARQKENA